jgi:hypothetical protein
LGADCYEHIFDRKIVSTTQNALIHVPTELQLKFFAFEFKADKNASGIHTKHQWFTHYPSRNLKNENKSCRTFFLSSPKLETFVYLQSKRLQFTLPKNNSTTVFGNLGF